MRFFSRGIVSHIVLFLVFCVTVAGTILVAHGYRYDFSAQTIVQKGLLSLEAEMPQVSIFLDGKRVVSDLPFRKSLEPGYHKLQIQHPFFFPWEKRFLVQSGAVTVFEKIILIPRNVQDYLFPYEKDERRNGRNSIDPEKFLVSDLNFGLDSENSPISSDKEWSLIVEGSSLYVQRELSEKNAENRGKEKGGEEIDSEEIDNEEIDNEEILQREKFFVTRFSKPIQSASWFVDSEHIVVQLGNQLFIMEEDGQNVIQLFEMEANGRFGIDQVNRRIFINEGKKWRYLDLEPALELALQKTFSLTNLENTFDLKL